jgi:predicted component of viral defense system (DUF524 family)
MDRGEQDNDDEHCCQHKDRELLDFPENRFQHDFLRDSLIVFAETSKLRAMRG